MNSWQWCHAMLHIEVARTWGWWLSKKWIRVFTNAKLTLQVSKYCQLNKSGHIRFCWPHPQVCSQFKVQTQVRRVSTTYTSCEWHATYHWQSFTQGAICSRLCVIKGYKDWQQVGQHKPLRTKFRTSLVLIVLCQVYNGAFGWGASPRLNCIVTCIVIHLFYQN